MKPRKTLTPGYRAYNGKILTKLDCQRYNRIQNEINRWIAANREVPPHLLDESHLVFNTIIGNIY